MRYLFIFSILVLMPGTVIAQQQIQPITGKVITGTYDSIGLTRPDPYIRAWSKTGSITPKGAVQDDHPLIFSVILEYKDSILLAPKFSEGASEAFKDFIRANLKNLAELPWDTKIPETKGLKDFKIFWIHCYLLENKSSGLHPWLSADMVSQLSSALSFSQQQNGVPLFIAPPYYVFSWASTRCGPR
ncbi:hypothetical protein ACE38W_13590 [Chitinophaga sp. Hz27]|uniref:hypothetical protein n=1 Tax=Chitinophaga sp. Hz27 TaxID=3347169 RepID=UPI0035DF5868